MEYPDMNEQIQEFPIYIVIKGPFGTFLLMNKNIKSVKDYDHNKYKLHHYIKEQQYYRYPERYKGLQKLLLIEKQMHADLHSAMSDKRFYDKYNIDKDYLLYRQRKVV